MSDPRPNVLIILTDDEPLAASAYMPKLQERVVSKGLSFSRAYITTPVCGPSRATMFSGRYAHSHGIADHDRHASRVKDSGLMRDTYATRLQDAGYRTGLFGKFTNGYGSQCPRWVPPGFSRWFARTRPTGGGCYEINEDGNIKESCRNWGVLTAETAESFIRNSQKMGVPWLCVASLESPHAPYTPTEKHAHDFDGVPLPWTPSFDEADVSDKPAWMQEQPRLSDAEKADLRRTYEGQLEELQDVDDAIVRFDIALEETGQAENTVVVYLTDNGYLLGEHRLASKGVVYEPAVRTPLYVRGPGIPVGSRDALVANVDLAATVCSLAGEPAPAESEGRSLVGLFGGEDVPWREALLLEWPASDWLSGSSWAAVRTASRVYVEHDTGEVELYDMDVDPYQMVSLHDDPDRAEELKSLSAKLEGMRNASGESLRAAETAP